MKHKDYQIQPEDMAELDLSTVDFYIEFDENFVFGYSPVTLAAVCLQSPVLAQLFADKLTAMAAAVNSRADAEWLRPGLNVYLDDKDWLNKMAKIAAVYAIGESGADVAAAEAIAPMPSQEIRGATVALIEIATPAVLGNSIAVSDEMAAASPAEGQPEQQAEQVPLYLPAANIGQFLLPNMFARSRLFHSGGARNSTRQVWSPTKPLVIQRFSGVRAGETCISYGGEELHMGDLELWTMLLNFAAGTALGEDVTARFLDLLPLMPGRGTGSNPRERLRNEGNRLQGGTLKIRTTDQCVIQLMKQCLPKNKSIQEADRQDFAELSFSLLESFSSSRDSVTFRISRELRALFGNKVSSWFDLDTYYSLPQAGLSRRLHVLYNSHYDCWPLKVVELQEYLGVLAKTVGNIKSALKAAHDELKQRGIIIDWEYRKPTEKERKQCDGLCFVVQRPNRESKAVPVLSGEGKE